VIAQGSGDESLVWDDVDRQALLQRLGRTVLRHGWSCLAFCLLDTHFHAVVGTPTPNLGRGMQWLLAPYARDFNERHERRGNLFHSRFYSKRVTSPEQLVATLVYVYLNPVRAGIVERAEAWSWSSYSATVGRRAPPDFLDRRAVLEIIDPHGEVAPMRLELAVREARERDLLGAGVRHRV
jgi:putative transposase